MPGTMKRRDFLAVPALAAAQPGRRKRIAALTTTYHVRSHADNIITRFLEGYWINEKFYPPPCDVVSLYMDQVHPADIGRRLSTAYGFPVVKSIAEALTLGKGALDVDGVLLVAEHGNYPFNDRLQQLYPRFEFFEQVVDVFRKSGRSVPVFNDKHLSYDWQKARRMYDWSRELNFPFLAGSSVSLTFRRPQLDYPLGVEFDEGMAVGGGWVSDGGVFHDLEAMQCLLERRKGGETGVRAVQYLAGDEVWKAAAAGRWSKELLQAALSRAERAGPGRPEDVKGAVVCLVEYNDGLRGSVVKLPGLLSEYLVAFKVKGKPAPDAALCYVPIQNSNNFSMLVHGAVQMFETGRRPYAIERTLLTTGITAFLMESAYLKGRRVETPQLEVRYSAPPESFYAHGRGS